MDGDRIVRDSPPVALEVDQIGIHGQIELGVLEPEPVLLGSGPRLVRCLRGIDQQQVLRYAVDG